MKKTKVRFRCPQEWKSEFRNSKCVVIVSVGQKYHEGEKFRLTLEAINKFFKEECTIMVCDSLQRHNVIFHKNITNPDYYAESVKAGDDWIKRNQNSFLELTIPYKIMRWDEWLAHPKYQVLKDKIDHLYDADIKTKIAINNTIDTFLIRRAKRDDRVLLERKKFFNSSLEYLKEEMAVMSLWVEKEFEFEIYPQKKPEAVYRSYNLFVKPHYPKLLRRITLDFKRCNISE